LNPKKKKGGQVKNQAQFTTEYLNAPIFNPLQVSVENVEGLAGNLSELSIDSPSKSGKEYVSLSTVIQK